MARGRAVVTVQTGPTGRQPQSSRMAARCMPTDSWSSTIKTRGTADCAIGAPATRLAINTEALRWFHPSGTARLRDFLMRSVRERGVLALPGAPGEGPFDGVVDAGLVEARDRGAVWGCLHQVGLAVGLVGD